VIRTGGKASQCLPDEALSVCPEIPDLLVTEIRGFVSTSLVGLLTGDASGQESARES
jgi:hypothetical protein